MSTNKDRLAKLYDEIQDYIEEVFNEIKDNEIIREIDLDRIDIELDLELIERLYENIKYMRDRTIKNIKDLGFDNDSLITYGFHEKK